MKRYIDEWGGWMDRWMHTAQLLWTMVKEQNSQKHSHSNIIFPAIPIHLNYVNQSAVSLFEISVISRETHHKSLHIANFWSH